MTRLFAPALALLALTASPALADDLVGMWKVEGTLPDGTGYTATAAISKYATNRYRILARGKLYTKRSLFYRASAKRSGSKLEVKHVGKRGLVGRILGPLEGPPPAVVGRYKIESDGSAFGGRFRPEGTTQYGTVRYTSLATPTAAFKPGKVTLRVGETRTVELTCTSKAALGLVRVTGRQVSRQYWSKGKRRIEVEGKTVGTHTLRVRLGYRGGAILKGTLEVVVLPGLLEDVVSEVKRLKSEGKQPIVIFDLDDTLFDTRYRVREILRDYGAEINEPRLKKLSVRHVRYELPVTLKNAGFTEAEIKGDLGKKIKRAWSKRFWTAFELDKPIKGAVKYVEKLVKAGARIVYVTGRREKTKDACLDVLLENDYPADEPGNLFCKPNNVPGQPKISTEAFKEATAKKLAQEGTIVAAFDNEPGNANAFLKAAPKAKVAWLETMWKPDSPELVDGIFTLADFR